MKIKVANLLVLKFKRNYLVIIFKDIFNKIIFEYVSLLVKL